MKSTLNIKSLLINIASVAIAVAIGVPLGSWMVQKFGTRSSQPVATEISQQSLNLLYANVNEDLIVFGDTKCGYCKEGIQLLKEKGASFHIFYIDQDPSARKVFDSLKADGVPVLISRRKMVVGFSKDVWDGFLSSDNS